MAILHRHTDALAAPINTGFYGIQILPVIVGIVLGCQRKSVPRLGCITPAGEDPADASLPDTQRGVQGTESFAGRQILGLEQSRADNIVETEGNGRRIPVLLQQQQLAAGVLVLVVSITLPARVTCPDLPGHDARIACI
jgi:hypothetical protein